MINLNKPFSGKTSSANKGLLIKSSKFDNIVTELSWIHILGVKIVDFKNPEKPVIDSKPSSVQYTY